jgi:AAA domain
VTDEHDGFDVFDGPPPSHNVVALKPSAGKQPKRIVLALPEFLAQFVPPDYLIDRLLQRGYFYSLTGATGAGKTAIALLISILVATRGGGKKLGPYDVEHGRVLYITRENPTDVRMRLIGAAARMAFDPAGLDFLVLEDIRTIDRNVLSQITKEVVAFGELALVIVDTSFALFPGDDENSNQQSGKHARTQRRLCNLPGRPCVVTLCHPIKNAVSKESLIPRGGGAFLAEVDGNLCVLPSDDRLVELHWTGKLRGPDFDKLALRLSTVMSTNLVDSKGRVLPTVMAEVVSDAQVQEAEEKAIFQENALLKAMADEPNGSQGDWAQKCGWMVSGKAGEPAHPNKSLVRRVVERLSNQKLVTKEGRKDVLTKAGKKADEARRARKVNDAAL